jgi:hypothetical protein
MTGAQQIEITVGKAAPMWLTAMNQLVTLSAIARPVPTTRALPRRGRCRQCAVCAAVGNCRQCHHHKSGRPSAKRARDRL